MVCRNKRDHRSIRCGRVADTSLGQFLWRPIVIVIMNVDVSSAAAFTADAPSLDIIAPRWMLSIEES